MNVCIERILYQRPAICFQKTSPKTDWKNLPLKVVLPLLEQGFLHQQQTCVEDLTFLLQKCKKEGDRGNVLRFYAFLQKMDHQEVYTLLGNHLIPMLIDVGCIVNAQLVFEKVVYRNEWSCYSLISGYIRCRQPKFALKVYDQMQEKHSSLPSAHIFVALFKACATLKELERGIQLHSEVVMMGFLEENLFVGSSLVDMYVKCESLIVAHQVFDMLPFRDVVSWNILISGYADSRNAEEALRCFLHMQNDGVFPTDGTYVCILKACGSIKAIEKGQEIHADIERKGFLKICALVGNSLVDMYAKCGFPITAEHIFDRLPNHDIVSWNALISGYTDCGCSEEALRCYEKMLLMGVSPDAITLLCGLKACGRLGAMRKGEEIHAEIERQGILGRDPFVGSTLIDMYAKAGLLNKAQNVFENLPIRGVVSWTTLIAGYTQHGQGEEALKYFNRMKFEGIPPNAITYVWSLKACANTGAIEKGGEIHGEIERRGLLDKDLIGNTLVNMYAKCGMLPKAEQAFDKLRGRDVVSWTALMMGYAQLGSSEKVFHIFNTMQGEGVQPNVVTFVVLLSMCSRTGLVHKCQTYLETMSKDYGFIPCHHHIMCVVVNLLGMTGELENAFAVMPSHPSLLVCQTVLHACRKSGSLELGKWAFEHAIRLDQSDALAYVLMSYIVRNDGVEDNTANDNDNDDQYNIS